MVKMNRYILLLSTLLSFVCSYSQVRLTVYEKGHKNERLSNPNRTKITRIYSDGFQLIEIVYADKNLTEYYNGKTYKKFYSFSGISTRCHVDYDKKEDTGFFIIQTPNYEYVYDLDGEEIIECATSPEYGHIGYDLTKGFCRWKISNDVPQQLGYIIYEGEIMSFEEKRKFAHMQNELADAVKDAAPKFGSEFENEEVILEPLEEEKSDYDIEKVKLEANLALDARQREEAKKYIDRRKSADKYPSLENIDFLGIEKLGFSENTMGAQDGLITVFNEKESNSYKITANIFLDDLMEINLRLNIANSESIENNVYATVYTGVNEDNGAKVRVSLILHTEKTGGLMTIQHDGRGPIYLIVKYSKY